jgi:hypothetical protein
VGLQERMKCGGVIKDRDDHSINIEVLMTDDLVKINPGDPLRFAEARSSRVKIVVYYETTKGE